MSFNEEYMKLRKKRLEEEQKKQKSAPFVFESGPYQNATLTADDIAPVKSQNTVVIDDARDIGKKNTGSGLFKAGAFADSYQFGDVTKVILGTAGDAATGIVQGAAVIGEGLGDLISYGVAGVQDLVGKDDDAERLRKEAEKSQLGPLFDSFREKTNIDDSSLLGNFGYGIAQALGQVGVMIATGGIGSAAGLGTTGASALSMGVMGASSMGSGMSEAYQGGATDEEALAYGTMSGLIDVGTEMIFGGLGKTVKAIGISKGLTSIDDVFAKKLSSKISSQFFKNATEYGVKATAEGFEEVLAGLGSAVAKKLTYMSDEELSQLAEDENLLEQFAVGAIASGIAQSGDLVKSTKQGRDFITNFSGNEETVIEKEFENRVAEAEQDGKKLTKKEKNEIYEQVQADMRKGYISTDTIESVLGGETYRSYKNSFDIDEKNQAEIKKEIEKLENLPKDQITVKQHERLLQLREELKAIENDTTTQNWKDELDVKISSTIASDNFLKESYYERARRGTAFEADLSQYDDKTAETVKRAIDSGILNNTRRTHEFVDMVAKISADKGVLFDFTNNAKLKESGFAVGGASINGYVTKDGITVNISSSKATNSIVGHEITHVLEGTELYEKMQSALFEYAKSKNDYDSRRKSLEELYKNVEDADIDAELTADLVGDYLFTDEDFINNLSTKHRNVFQKIYDEIKYLYKIATAGSKEARELEKVKRAFDKAYRANGNASGDTKYSLSDKNIKDISTDYAYGEYLYTMAYTQDGKVVGTLKYGEYDGEPNVKMIEVAPEYRRKGIATKLLQELQNKYPDVEIDFGMSTPDGTKLLDAITYDVTDNAIVEDRQKLKDLQTELNELQEKLDVLYDTDNLTEAQDKELQELGDRWQEVYETISKLEKDLRGKKATKTFVKTDTKYSLSSKKTIDKYTQKQYNDFGWARDTEAISKNELDDLYSKVQEKGSLKRFPQSSNGEAIIEVNDNPHTTLGTNNVFVFVTGTKNNPQINKVVRFQAETDTEMEIIKEKLYERGSFSNTYYSFLRQEGLAREYSKKSALNYYEYTQKVRRGSGGTESNRAYGDRGFDKDGTRAVAETQSNGIAPINKASSKDGVFFDGKKTKLSLSADKDYLDAVERGDIETAQKIVDDTAKATMPNSKIVNSDGTLKKVYHGSPSEFNIFDYEKIGSIGHQEGFGFYFADTETITKHYGNSRAFYLDIQKPMYSDRQTITRQELKRFIKAIDPDGNGVISGYEDAGYIGYETALQRTVSTIMEYNDNDQDIIYEVANADGWNYTAKDFLEFARILKDTIGYDGLISKWEVGDVYVVFDNKQMKLSDTVTYDNNGKIIPLSERFNANDNDIRYSLSKEGETPKRYGNYNIFGDDIRLEAPTQEEVAPIQEDVAPESEVVAENAIPTENIAPMPSEPTLYELEQKQTELEETIRIAMESNDPNAPKLIDEYGELLDTIAKRKKEESAMESERLASLVDADVPPELEAPYYDGSADSAPENPFEDRDIKAVGNRKVKAYMYENPEVKPFFQEEANRLLGELDRAEPAQSFYNGWLKYEMGYDAAQDIPEVYRVKMSASPSIVDLRENVKLSYDDIRKGLNAIIEDNGAENIAAAKKIEFELNKRLMEGYVDDTGYDVPPNQDYINLLKVKQITEYSEEARAKFFEEADKYAPPVEDIAPTAENTAVNEPKIEKPIEDAPIVESAQTAKAYEAIKPKKQTAEPKMKRVKDGEQSSDGIEPQKVAEIITEEPVTSKKKNRAFTQARTNLLDKGSVFEDLSLKSGNRELQAKYNFMHYSEARAQKYIAEHLKPIVDKVEQSGKSEQLYEYVYHLHNIDRMSLEAKGGKNKAVFGDTITADISRKIVKDLETQNPEFKELSKEIIAYNAGLRQMLVDKGVISQETADLWAKIYPHYVPIRRLGDEGLSVNVPLDTRKTGINAPIKRAKGGNRDIMPLFDTMAMRTEQTFKAIAKNSFGTELMHTLKPAVDSNATSLDEMIESVENHEELLQAGKNGKNPTFTVFENGKKVTFEINEDMYEALKPTSKGLSYTNKVANTASNIFRGILTEYNPVFMVSNAAKDIQDVLINSQHAAKTYANIPRAIAELTTKGKWYAEYMANGGEQNTYFDSESKTFKEENKGFIKTIGMPIRAISTANNFIERVPRLAEYIASREAGASVEVAMLDAARVTTNFSAGGDVTKFLNRNGATFLNASVQGFNQNVRNIREAKANGLKGWLKLSAKVALAGLPALLLNNLLWDDDEEYEELSEYVKDNYYIVAKTEDGKFIRIPKGRVAAVIQDAFEQINNAATGNDEVDFKNFFNLAISNLAPNNPIENNILSPIMQVASNKTWYGEDLVPTRLQDLPAAEQFDESTDAISKWLGEKANISPYKLNYLLDQYSGGVGDVFLPMMTPEAESGDNSLGGNMLAPMKDKFTTDSTLNNKNVSDFYDTMDELTTNAKSSKATDEDILKYKYFNSINAELSELYAQKREIQNSNLADDEKYEAVRELQEQINDLARESLNTYENVYISDGYATIGDIHYRWYEPSEDSDAEAGWQKITDKQLEKQEAVTKRLGVEPSEYWKNKTEYDFAYEYPEKYSVAKSVGGYSAYKRYTSEMYDIKADKDEDGKSISGSRKEKVIEYVNNLDIDYGARLILFKSEYNADDTYNYDIIDYLNNRQDISYEEMETILKELGFTVLSDGTIQWD